MTTGTRSTDTEAGGLVSPLKITREIPLHWLIGLLIAGVVQAVLVYYTVDRQGELIRELTAQVRALVATSNLKDMKDLEHDMKITDMIAKQLENTRRMMELEARLNVATQLPRK